MHQTYSIPYRVKLTTPWTFKSFGLRLPIWWLISPDAGYAEPPMRDGNIGRSYLQGTPIRRPMPCAPSFHKLGRRASGSAAINTRLFMNVGFLKCEKANRLIRPESALTAGLCKANRAAPYPCGVFFFRTSLHGGRCGARRTHGGEVTVAPRAKPDPCGVFFFRSSLHGGRCCARRDHGSEEVISATGGMQLECLLLMNVE